ncbi:hypothetical protein C1701_23510 [Actinoalloteichus sp. AHMU CJ021]|uniref:Secreted protein n=1 Tax=Actinoalloteichus caeruleus DSM 43889 TaxID=1120930 RepID=A0ABT1JCM0_ACTCY|nr:hypothetical protein [Actinoalloteichus caeruleus]AUS80819.1 hypothetical protein C1701_23510 [Actinoalloteichus sp. AHMU CJ021]MCP2330233.1 hypothetical protein [Actinoalloteichus caeruleus DSM 43889]
MRATVRGLLLAAAVGGAVVSVAPAVSAATIPADVCSPASVVEVASCTPYWKQSEGHSSKSFCDWAGSSGAQAGRWTGWNCSQALNGWELWVRTCTARAGETPASREESTV